MGDVVNIGDSEKPVPEEISWAVRLDGQRLSAEEFARFKAWHDQSQSHTEKFSKVAALWRDLDMLSDVPMLPLEVARRSWRQTLSRLISPVMIRRQFAVMTAMIIFAAMTVMFLNQGQDKFIPVIHTSAIGARKTIDLADGSRVILNTGSQIEVLYTPERRIVRLMRGEAYFTVAHNKSRPFEVYAGTNIVRAVGTAFAVELRPELVEVTVTQGQVQLATLGSNDGPDGTMHEIPLALVRSGQNAEISDRIKSITSIDQKEIDRRLAWKTGGLIFRGEALEDVIREVSRYTTTKIIISDPAIRKIKIGGYFKTSETDAMLQALETSFGVSVRRVGRNLVYLSRSSDK